MSQGSNAHRAKLEGWKHDTRELENLLARLERQTDFERELERIRCSVSEVEKRLRAGDTADEAAEGLTQLMDDTGKVVERTCAAIRDCLEKDGQGRG